ncbi:beta-ketoacyl synthase N-terminal-like domain-containing protein [Chryseobacterium lathyri]|uniref:beta-ketoacyl synthase N-terminal-like domain-containing protein n=1 Tax=Chryseobacterium lathyri TaxID=395933 RepID=UPI002788EA3F|nr:beta-ketoacyl synthase N-terminal-like domain-containing protein [Chryseobacterium lathyri]MDQ0068135.1 3-oxoacyl-(acyl-carrier-protein) synthase/phosphopantetheinyl transferase [Chryseobacterium lathyri]
MKKTDVAVIGLSCVFPGAQDAHTFWQNIVNKVDSTQLAPADRIDPVHFSDATNPVDRFYCQRGGFISDYEFDPTAFGILPLAVEGTEPDHLLTLDLVQKALEDAGVFQKQISLEKTGIIIGKGNYTGPGATRAIEIVRTGEQISSLLKELLPQVSSADIEKVKHAFQERKGRFAADTAMGLIPNLVASLVANRFNLGGAAFTVDAACASALIAVDHAVQELNRGRCNMVIAGGVHTGQNAAFWSIFAQLGALSHQQQIKPFSTDADGLLIGEGCGFVVLKRLEDAVRDQDKIYAVIKGVGVSSDGNGTSVMSPSVKGQLKALQQAWINADLDEKQIGYLEAHGTGTPLGDKTELQTLAQFFTKEETTQAAGIGSVKSNIGHAMPAAGIAGLIKTCLALHHDTLPPTLYCENPIADMEQTRFAPVQEPKSWSKTGLPKVAAVNAFGFGGINAHVVLEGYDMPKKDRVLVLARPTQEELLSALKNNDNRVGEGDYRIALFDPTPERREKAIKIVAKNNPWRNKQDIWYTNTPLLKAGGKIAFVFPGLDGLAKGEVDSVSRYFGLTEPIKTEGDGLLSDALGVFNKCSILDHALKKLGIVPDMNAGHSLGEWLAGYSSELAEVNSVKALINVLNPETFELKDSRFIAIGAGIDMIKPLIDTIPNLYISNDNCPNQVILCGSNAALDELVPLLKSKQVFHQVLPFQSGFHSPFIADKLDVILAGMEKAQFQQTKIPLWSATTLEPYPDDQDAIRKLSAEHLVQPVRFRELTDKLYEEGARFFIQIGTGGLIGFIDDTLKGKAFSTIASSVATRSALAQLQRVVAALFVEGKTVALDFLEIQNLSKKSSGKGIKLQLGSPIIRDFKEIQNLAQPFGMPKQNTVSATIAKTGHPLVQAFQENITDMIRMQEEVLTLFQNRPEITIPKPVVPKAPVSKNFSKLLHVTLDTHPYLIDHSLLRQPKGWAHVSDMEPVIPMTMIFEQLAEIAQAEIPGTRVHKIMNVSVFQWMNVAKPFEKTVKGEWRSNNHAYLDIENFANAEILLASSTPAAPAFNLSIGDLLPIERTPEEIYDKHMFHGESYQGITEISAVGTKGIVGKIKGNGGKGSLLDNAGQLFGLWLQLTLTKDRIAFPVKIRDIEFFGDMEDQNGLFECTCILTELNEEFAIADIILKRDGKVWCAITGWQNRRLEIDEPLWNVSMSPLHNRLSEEIVPEVFFFHQAYTRVASWDFILKRYFNRTEKQYHQQLLPNKRKEWMVSRVAVKDAVRNLLREKKNHPCFPITFEIGKNEVGKPYLIGNATEDIHISLAHKEKDAVGIARQGGPVGIDMEIMEERSSGFYDLVFTGHELTLLKDRDQAEWTTKFWVAKEAYGKFLGTGLKGNPKAFEITHIEGDHLWINQTEIKTIKHKKYIIGWTL